MVVHNFPRMSCSVKMHLAHQVLSELVVWKPLLDGAEFPLPGDNIGISGLRDGRVCPTRNVKFRPRECTGLVDRPRALHH